jgi:uncharacterized membrane protein
MNQLATYLLTLTIFVGVDLVWLGYIAKSFYRAEIGSLLANKMSLPAAAAFYLIYSAGLMLFVIQPSIDGGWSRALVFGSLFGFVAYATYDLSNLATLRGWTLKLSVVDMVWGAALSGFTAAATLIIAGRFAGRGAL